MRRGLVVGIAAVLSAFLSLPLAAQTVTRADLEGASVEADIHREQTVRNPKGTRTVRIHQNWQISVDASGNVEYTITSTARGPGGTQKAEPTHGTLALDAPHKTPKQGGGDVAWTFAEGTLTFTRTFNAGAFRAQFAFAHSPSGLTCTVTEGFAREEGRGEIKLISPFSNSPVTILSSRQLPSTCRVMIKK